MTPVPTERQKSVLSMAADGCDAQQIALYLYLKCAEVRRIMADCMDRMGATTWMEAADTARELQLIGTGRVVA